MFRKILWLAGVTVTGIAIGCGQNNPPKADQAKDGGKTALPLAADGKKYLLDAEPSGAKGVLATRKEAKDGDEVVMVGRIAGSRKPFVEGRASFSVTDLTIPPCDDAEGCKTPWDCCCTSTDDLLPAMAQIKIEGSDGKTLAVGAKDLLGVKELNVVVVRGTANRDVNGNLTVVASGLHVRNGK